MMNEFLILAISVVAGIVLGTFFFGGLWLTLRQLPHSQRPALLTLGSFFGRTAVCIFGFYLVVMAGDWKGLLAGLGGFMLMRFVLVRRLGPENRNVKEVKWLK